MRSKKISRRKRLENSVAGTRIVGPYMKEKSAVLEPRLRVVRTKWPLISANMLHELLLALAGNSGGIFVYKKNGGLQVAGDLPFLHPCEVSLLNRICKLGSYFKRFQVFSRRYTDLSPLVKKSERRTETREPFGLYIQAFCMGLDNILKSYTTTLVELEEQILKDPKFPLSHIEHSLDQYQVLFPALADAIEEIQESKAAGCRILDILHKSCNCGVPNVKEALERILWVCHGVMYKQLSAWLLHGMLIDNHKEFFIHELTNGSNNAGVTSPSDQADGGTDLGIPGVTGKQLAETMEWDVKKRLPVQKQFAISAEMLPSYIPTRVANKILFTGEAMRMFENSKIEAGSKALGSIIRENEELFMRSLYALQQKPTFNLLAFESEVDTIRKCVAEHLWKLIIEEGKLQEHLMMLKDFFLLGRGEVFSTFISHAASLLKVPPLDNTSHDANASFQQVLRKFVPDDDEMTSLLSIVVDPSESRHGTRPDQPVVSGWDCIKLKYDVRWPLHILFRPDVLEEYNTLFRHLLNVKRTQQDLQQLWALYKDTKHSSPSQLTASSKMWLLRMHMAFLVDNLQYYLQVDVLEVQHSQMVQKINATRDFEAISLAHDYFIRTIMTQSFLDSKSPIQAVARSLEEILYLCQSFCALIMQATDGLSERQQAQAENISKNYKRQARLLFDILSSMRSREARPHLAQLLLRIDFNKHFSLSSLK